MLAAAGCDQPLVVGEYNAPWPELFPEATAAMQAALAAALAGGGGEEAAMAKLYEGMAGLPPQLQMFMRGCPPELDAKRDRINCRELVMRNLLALAAGVRRTVCWNLAPEIPGYQNRLSIMDLLFASSPCSTTATASSRSATPRPTPSPWSPASSPGSSG
jgi:hypothetical protein